MNTEKYCRDSGTRIRKHISISGGYMASIEKREGKKGLTFRITVSCGRRSDRKQKKEYAVKIKDKTITEVDNDQTKYLVYDNNIKKELTKSDYFMKDFFFDNNLIIDKKITKSKELKKEYNYYYFIEDSKLYKALDTNKTHRIFLA